MTLLDVRLGDLATARADAIATSAGSDLQVGGGVNAAIHAAAGPELARHTAELGGCAVGEAKTTPAGRLSARYVIHGVAPRWKDGLSGETKLLAALYEAIVREAVRHGCRTLALPSFGTGSFGTPEETAAATACDALAKALLDDYGQPVTPLRIVRFWVASESTRDAYAAAIGAAHRRLRPVSRESGPGAAATGEPTSDTRPLPFRRVLDEDDFTLVQAGLPALEMEEKWRAFWTGSHLRIFRSWTGFEIYSLRTRPRPDGEPGAILDQLHFCDDPARTTASDEEALQMLDAVLSRILRL